MWLTISGLILRNRILILAGLIIVTSFFGYHATKIELSYDLAKVLPTNEQAFKDYERFKSLFGEDGNVMVIGFKSDKLFEKDVYNGWYELSSRIKKLRGIKDVLSIGRFYNITKDSIDALHIEKAPGRPAFSQQETDSLRQLILSKTFYKDIILNDSSATLIAITFEKKRLNSANRIITVNAIKDLAAKFGESRKIKMHYSGMPYIRTEFMVKVADEMVLFMLLAFLVTTTILYVFFRSHLAVIFSTVVILIGVIWSLGTIQILGYKITLLSGLIPPLIMIISVPNCIFLLNKYHSELKKHSNKVKSLTKVIQTIGISLLLANITTAIGFGVFYFTDSDLLKEFGVVAAINVTGAYLVSLVFIPIAFSFLPVPNLQHTARLQSPVFARILNWINYAVQFHRKKIYWTISLLTLISILGITKATIRGYLVDDLPKNHPIYHDLRFFESNFNGVLPFEVLIVTNDKNGLYANSGSALYKTNALQKVFASRKEFSRPLSFVEMTKFLYQSYRGGEKRFYVLPGAMQLQDLSQNIKLSNTSSINTFSDSLNQIGRISYQVADVGSDNMQKIISDIKVKSDSIFKDSGYKVIFTGYSTVFLKSNEYLLRNLFESLLIAIFLITLVGLLLFRSLRIILLSKIPCLIPLIFTAGIMGFFDIYFKPSTILIFSIAFGIASDGTIYFLTKYRQELFGGRSSAEAVSITIKETGVSMIYTSIILFFGFGIFVFSGFGGTVALGILISTTIMMGTCTNLILLPSFLLSNDKFITRKNLMKKQLINIPVEDSGL